MNTLEWIALLAGAAALVLLFIRTAYQTGYDTGFEDGLTMEKFDLPAFGGREKSAVNGDMS